MKKKTLVKIVALSALLVLVGLLAGCLMEAPPSKLVGTWVTNTTLGVGYEFKEGEVCAVAVALGIVTPGAKICNAKYTINTIISYDSSGNKKGTAKYSIKDNKLTIESNDITGLAAGTYIKK